MCDFCGKKSGTGGGLFMTSSVVVSQYYPSSVPHSFIFSRKCKADLSETTVPKIRLVNLSTN